MRFCKECGHPLESEQTVCTQCGNPVPARPQPNSAPKKPLVVLTKITKIIILSAVSLIILLVIGYKIGVSLTDKQAVLDKFQKALLSGNAKAVAAYLHTNDSRLKIDDQAVASFIDYTKKYPSYVNQLFTDLKQQTEVDTLSSKKISKDLQLNGAQSSLLTFKKNGRTGLVFVRYVLEVKSNFIRVSSNLDKTKISLNGSDIGTVDKADSFQEFGPYLFGSYKIKGIYQGEYASIEQEQDVQLFNPMENKINVNITFKTDYVFPKSNFDDAKLFINSKDVGTVRDKAKLGPVALDGSVKMYAEKAFPWGSARSKEIAVTSSNNVDLTIGGVTDELKTTLMNTLNEFNKSDIAAKTNRDAGKYVHVFPDKLVDYTRTIDNMKSYDQYYKGRYTKALFDLDSFQIYIDRNQYFATVSAHEFYEGAYYRPTDTNIQLRNSDVSWKYTLLYRDGQWYVYDHSQIYSLDSTNTKVFDFAAGSISASSSGVAADAETQIRAAVDRYEKKLIEAINGNNFSKVESILTPGSELYKAQKALVDNLGKHGIKEELVSYEITDVMAGDKPNEYKVNVKEKTTIISLDNSETKDFNWVYTAVLNGSAYTLSAIKKP